MLHVLSDGYICTKGWLCCSFLCVCVCLRVESGSDDPDNVGHLVTFLMGQVGIIYILNYLDVIWIF